MENRFRRILGNRILDTKTSIKWLIGPDVPLNYYDAEKWIKSNEGYRFPILDELKELYQEGISSNNLNPKFGIPTDNLAIWAKELPGHTVAGCVCFRSGSGCYGPKKMYMTAVGC